MGVMSKAKGGRLPERPQPPSWDAIEEDVSAASKDDVVFSVGKSNLPNITAQSLKEKTIPPGSSSTAETSDPETSHTDPQEVQASYENVLRLIASHEHLCRVPASLREQYANLQGMGEDMVGSISQLKDLAQKVSRESKVHRNAEKGEGKGKAKQKRKK